MTKTNLTDKQQAFCEEYIITLNATDAAIKAKYSKKTANRIASQNLAKPEIQSYIQELMKDKDKTTIAKQDEILEKLTLIIRNKESKDSDIIRACELLGKRYAIFTEIHNHNLKTVKKLEDYFK